MKLFKKSFMVALPLATLLSVSGCSMLDNVLGGEENGEYVSLEYTISESQEKVQTLGQEKGYEITIQSYEDSTGSEKETNSCIMGMKNNVQWYIDVTNGDGYALVTGDERCHLYEYSDNAWSYSYSFDTEEVQDYYSYVSVDSLLYFGYVYNGMVQKIGEETVAGRKCDSYKFAMNLVVEKMEYKICIDQETGLTLKYTLAAAVYGQSANVGFEVTAFKTGSKVSAPSLPEPEDTPEEEYE